MTFLLGESEIAALQSVLMTADGHYEANTAAGIKAIIQSCLSSGKITASQRKRLLLLLTLAKQDRSENENSTDPESLKYYYDNGDPCTPTPKMHAANETARVFRQQAVYRRFILPRLAFAIYFLPYAGVGYHRTNNIFSLKGAIENMATQQGKDFRASLKANVDHKKAQQAAQAKAKKSSGGEQRERSRGGEGRSR